MTQLSFSEYYAMQKNEGGTVFAMLSLDLNNADESQRRGSQSQGCFWQKQVAVAMPAALAVAVAVALQQQ